MRDFRRKTAWVKTGSPHMDLYIKPSTGSDANDGLSSSAPMKTFAALFDRHGSIIDNDVRVNVDENSTANDIIDVYVAEGHYLLIEGGTGLVPGGATYVPSVADKEYFSVSPDPGWTTDMWVGWWCRVDSGAKLDEMRMVQRNTSDTVYFGKWFGGGGGVGQFRHYVSNREINHILQIRNNGPGELRVQRFNVSGNGQLSVLKGSGVVTFAGLTRNGSTTEPDWLVSEKGSLVGVSDDIRDATDPSTFDTDAISGIGDNETASGIKLDLSPNAEIELKNLITRGTLEIWGGTAVKIGWGGKVGTKMFFSQSMRGVNSLDSLEAIIGATPATGYAVFRVGGSGLRLRHAVANMRKTDISNCSNSGIQLFNSNLMMHDTVTGTGNTGFGVYMRGASTLIVGDTVTPPTLTGTVGDISFDDTTEHADWTEIIAGDQVADAAKGNHVYEVSDSWYLAP